MSRLIIWDKETKIFLEDFAESEDDIILYETKGQKPKNCEYKSFDEIRNISPLYEAVIILVELGWEGHQLQEFYGYRVLLQLMEKDIIKPPIDIFFISMLDRTTIDSLTKDEKHICVKVFPHIKINNSDSIIIPTEPNFPLKKYEFLKKYVLTESGILDIILHDVNRLLGISDNTIIEETKELIERLLKLQNILGGENVSTFETFKKTKQTIESTKKFLNTLSSLIRKRINDLSPNAKIKPSNTRYKYKVLLLEDDKNTLNYIKESLDPFFEINDFYSGKEAKEELELRGKSYHGLITDMELLDKDKFYQNIQGVQVLDYAREHHPHIAQRIISGVPRKGLLELLPEMSYKNIIHKSLIQTFGINDLVSDFVIELKTDIKKLLHLLKSPGPNNAFWADYTITKKDGGRFKRFYYRLESKNEKIFNKMWDDIDSDVNKVLAEQEIKIGCKFVKTDDAKELIEKFTEEDKKDFLKQLLTHRLVIISRYKNRSNFIYKNTADKSESYFHLPIWDKDLPANPKQYFYFLGFGAPHLNPQNPTIDDGLISFTLEYNQLFEKEIEWLKSHSELRTQRIEIFYLEHEDFCKEIIDGSLWIISEDKKQNGSVSQFKRTYPVQLENVIDIDENYVINVLMGLSSEDKVRNRHAAREKVLGMLTEFKYNDNDDECSDEYGQLNTRIRVLIDKAIDSL
jgi:hypothetical protein